MRKLLFLLFIIYVIPNTYSQNLTQKDSLKNILIVTAHPDDWELAMGGTAYLLRDKYHIHVLIATKGEKGLSKDWKEPSEKTAKLREKQAIDGCRRINAQLHFMGKMDGEIYSDKQGVDSIMSILNELDPAIIFTHWPLDKPDHGAVGGMVTHALQLTGRAQDREVYFFGVQQLTLQHFDPDLYVNITNVMEVKKELIRLHALHDDDEIRLVKSTEDLDIMYGQVARCKYAEAFKTFYPLIGNRWNKKVKFSLLDL